jgi:hypothetical protein
MIYRTRQYTRYEVWRSMGAVDYYVRQFASRKLANDYVSAKNSSAPRCVLYYLSRVMKGESLFSQEEDMIIIGAEK